MNSTIKYKDNDIIFYDLFEQGHNLDKFVIHNELYHRQDHQFDHLLSYLKPNSIVYDIGAYIGTFSIPFALEGMKVHSFEGFPDNFTRLKMNCSVYDNIQVYLVALSNKNSTTHTKFNDCTSQEPQERDIQFVVFDEYIKQLQIEKPDLIKLDIEGMETLALFGMTDLIENVRPVWQIGYHAGLDIQFDGYPGFVKPVDGGFDFNTFNKLGYDVYNERQELVNEFTSWGEYICIPKVGV